MIYLILRLELVGLLRSARTSVCTYLYRAEYMFQHDHFLPKDRLVNTCVVVVVVMTVSVAL